MPILNIELSEYDALRDRVKELEAENKTLKDNIDNMVEKDLLRMLKKTVIIERHLFSLSNDNHFTDRTVKYEFLNFEDIEAEAKSQFFKDMANRIQSEEQQEINRLNDQNRKLMDQLDKALGRIDRLQKRGFLKRLINKED